MEQLLNRIRKIYTSSGKSLSELEEIAEECSFYLYYTEKINTKNLITAATNFKNDFLLAALAAKRENETFTKIKKLVEKFTPLSDNCNKYINLIVQLCQVFIDANLLEEISKIPLLNEECKKIKDDDENKKAKEEQRNERLTEIVLNNNEIYKILYKNNLIDSLTALHIALNRTLCKTEEARIAFFEILKKYPEDFLNILFLISNEPLDPSTHISDDELFIKNGTSVKLKKYIYAIIDRMNLLKEQIKTRAAKDESFEKKCNKIKKCILDAKGIKSIEIARHFFDSLENNEIKFNVIRYILYSNRDLYHEVEKQLEEEEKKSELEKVFNESIFPFKNLTAEQVKLLTDNANINHIRKMLQIFSSSNFRKISKANFPITEILLSSDPTIVNNIIKYYSQNLISEDFIINNPEIFIKEIPEDLKDVIRLNCKAQDFYNNINNLRERKVNILEISNNNPKLLLQEHCTLENNLKILDQYGINYEKAKKLSILNNINLIGYLDILIELGLYTYVKNNPDFIEEDLLTQIKRIILSKQLGIPFMDKKRISSNITGDNFKFGGLSINDEDIHNYLDIPVFRYANPNLFKILCTNQSYNYSDNDFEIETLKPYKKSDQLYDINGIKVSRNKVLRNYRILSNSNTNTADNEIIFNSIIFGSLYNSDDLDNLCTSINITTDIITYKKTL